jgi:hypothetical protein
MRRKHIGYITIRRGPDRRSSDPSASARNADCFQFGQIESVLSNALRRFEMNIGKGSLFTVERDEFESDTLTVFADFLGVKTACWQRQFASQSA